MTKMQRWDRPYQPVVKVVGGAWKFVGDLARALMPQRELWAVVRPAPGGSWIEVSVHSSFDEARIVLGALLPTRPDVTVMKHAEMQIANRAAAARAYGHESQPERIEGQE